MPVPLTVPVPVPVPERLVSTTERNRDPRRPPFAGSAPPGFTNRGSNVVVVRLNQKIAVGVVFVSAMFMNIMDITIVNVALPTIGRDFDIAPDRGGRHRDRLPGQPGRLHPGVGLAG